MARTLIRLEDYPRRKHYEHFLHMANPYVGITVEVGVGALAAACKRRGLSFYTAFMHAAALAADAVPAFRQRVCAEGIAEYDSCPTSHIELLGDGTYCYCTLRHHLPAEAFFREAEARRAAARERASIEDGDDVESLYFITCVPWLRYTALLQPTDGDSNPRISWGKYTPDGQGGLTMPVSVLAHHSLVDGIHLAAFYRQLDLGIARLAGAL